MMYTEAAPDLLTNKYGDPSETRKWGPFHEVCGAIKFRTLLKETLTCQNLSALSTYNRFYNAPLSAALAVFCISWLTMSILLEGRCAQLSMLPQISAIVCFMGF
jgi:hypothetical protein